MVQESSSEENLDSAARENDKGDISGLGADSLFEARADARPMRVDTYLAMCTGLS